MGFHILWVKKAKAMKRELVKIDDEFEELGARTIDERKKTYPGRSCQGF